MILLCKIFFISVILISIFQLPVVLINIVDDILRLGEM